METLGVWLRQTREAKGDSLHEVEAATRVRLRFLEALEAGDFAVFPGGEVQIRGFLRIYARYLGLPLAEVLARYDAEVHATQAAAEPTAPTGPQPISPARSITRPIAHEPHAVPVSTSRPRWLSLETLMIGAIILIVLLVAVAGVGYAVTREGDGKAAPTAAVPAAAVLPTAELTPAIPLVATPTFPADSQGNVSLTLEATEHVWVRVTGDGKVVLEGLMARGQEDTWSGQEAIIVDTGNGAGLQVTVNGQLQGTMCGRAQVCTRAWGPAGEIAVP
jgi:cytoskeleton protein RodZ